MNRELKSHEVLVFVPEKMAKQCCDVTKLHFTHPEQWVRSSCVTSQLCSMSFWQVNTKIWWDLHSLLMWLVPAKILLSGLSFYTANNCTCAFKIDHCLITWITSVHGTKTCPLTDGHLLRIWIKVADQKIQVQNRSVWQDLLFFCSDQIEVGCSL